MRMTLDEFTTRFPSRSRPIPAEYAGQWIAWNDDHTEILAHGGNLGDVRQQALQRGCVCPILQRLPNGPFVGGA
jgi:hypothetical protein